VSDRPGIGISSYGPLGKRAQLSLPVEHLRAVAGAGGIPLLLTAGTPLDGLLEALVARARESR